MYGLSWKRIENVILMLPEWRAPSYRAATGADLDMVLEKGRRRIAVECMVANAPQIGKRFWTTLTNLTITEVWITAPIKALFPLAKGATAAPTGSLLRTANLKTGFQAGRDDTCHRSKQPQHLGHPGWIGDVADDSVHPLP